MGIEFYDADAERIVYALNEEKLFNQGSTTKLLSVGTALTILGTGYRFHTRVYRTAPIDKDGTLRGDVILVASGDPNLSQRLQSDGCWRSRTPTTPTAAPRTPGPCREIHCW